MIDGNFGDGYISGHCPNCQAKYALLEKYSTEKKIVFYCFACGKYQQVKMEGSD